MSFGLRKSVKQAADAACGHKRSPRRPGRPPLIPARFFPHPAAKGVDDLTLQGSTAAVNRGLCVHEETDTTRESAQAPNARPPASLNSASG